MMIRFINVALAITLIIASACKSDNTIKSKDKELMITEKNNIDNNMSTINFDKETGMCAKELMSADGIVRLSKVEVYPQHLEEYLKYAVEVGDISLRTEPGVLTMYAVSEKDNPCKITILETYASREAYERHIASVHFQKYKQGTLIMVKTLELIDQNQLTESNRLINFVK